MPTRLQAQHVLLLLHVHWCCWELSAVSGSVVWVCFFPSESSITWISRNLPIWLLLWSQTQGVCWVLANSHLKNHLLLLTIGLERESFVMGVAFTGYLYSEMFSIKSQCPEHIGQDLKLAERKSKYSMQHVQAHQRFVPCAPAAYPHHQPFPAPKLQLAWANIILGALCFLWCLLRPSTLGFLRCRAVHCAHPISRSLLRSHLLGRYQQVIAAKHAFRKKL